MLVKFCLNGIVLKESYSRGPQWFLRAADPKVAAAEMKLRTMKFSDLYFVALNADSDCVKTLLGSNADNHATDMYAHLIISSVFDDIKVSDGGGVLCWVADVISHVSLKFARHENSDFPIPKSFNETLLPCELSFGPDDKVLVMYKQVGRRASFDRFSHWPQ